MVPLRATSPAGVGRSVHHKFFNVVRNDTQFKDCSKDFCSCTLFSMLHHFLLTTSCFDPRQMAEEPQQSDSQSLQALTLRSQDKALVRLFTFFWDTCRWRMVKATAV